MDLFVFENNNKMPRERQTLLMWLLVLKEDQKEWTLALYVSFGSGNIS